MNDTIGAYLILALLGAVAVYDAARAHIRRAHRTVKAALLDLDEPTGEELAAFVEHTTGVRVSPEQIQVFTWLDGRRDITVSPRGVDTTWVTNYRTCDTIEVDYILDPGTRVKDLGVLCACPNCRAAFQAATGLEAAPGGEVEPDIDNFDAGDTLGAWNGRINRTPSTHLSR